MEKGVQDARRRIWQEAAQARFGSSPAQCPGWPRSAWRRGTRRIRARRPEHPRRVDQECAQLMPMPTPFDGYVELPARVSTTSLVSAARNRYSVPCAFAGQRVSVRLYPERVVVVADQQVIAEHPRAVDRDHVVYDWQHYLPLVERKPGALRNGAPFADLPRVPAAAAACAAPARQGRQGDGPRADGRPHTGWRPSSSRSTSCSRADDRERSMSSTSWPG